MLRANRGWPRCHHWAGRCHSPDSGEKPDYDQTVVEKQTKTNGDGTIDFSDPDEGDEYFEEAKQLILQAGKASTSYLQRRLKVGYARAARIMDLLEEAGVIGPADGAKPREILITEKEIDTTSIKEEIEKAISYISKEYK